MSVTYSDHAARLASAIAEAIIQKRTLPLKFAYTGSAARTHLKLAALDSYKEVTFAAAFEAAIASRLLADTEIVIADIGPGDGQHSLCFLQELEKRKTTILNYVGLDFSDELMEVARHRIETSLKNIRASFRHWDVETQALQIFHSDTNTPRLVTFLGQTLGNLESPLQALQNIRNSVRTGDSFLLSVALQTEGAAAADYLRPYQNPTFMDAIAEPLRMCGLNPTQGRLYLDYENSAVVGKFMLGESQTVQHSSGPIVIPKDAIISCFKSRRFSYNDIEPMLAKAGWKLIMGDTNGTHTIGAYFAEAF